MNYYDVVVAGASGNNVFTYHNPEHIPERSLVGVPFRNQQAFGMVSRAKPRPRFKTKPISSVLPLPLMPEYVPSTIEWMGRYYGVSYGEALNLFLPKRPDLPPRRDPSEWPAPPAVDPPQFTADQQHLLATIMQEPGQHWLLHGVTGSGKTAVYIELARRMLQQGYSTIVLIPEIALATQTVATFQEALADKVFITHSHLTNAQRRSVWHRAFVSSEPVVILGPRSALFTPRHDLGVVIIDECHEQSYKQEQTPHYHARETARCIAASRGSTLLLGSATPGAHDIYQQRRGDLRLLRMPDAIHDSQRAVEIVDIRRQRGIITPQLHRALQETLEAGQQALLFINRRGSASQVLCRECGWIARCSECDIPQTWHSDSGRLRCHWCGFHQSLPGACPDCQGLQWRFLGLGTKRIESEMTDRFPDARIRRIDKDSFTPRFMQETLQQLHDSEIDIIIGTQMIAKGLDLPRVNLVGVVLADTLLYIPDMHSNERTYQLLHQVIGRAGRNHDMPSRVIIQTYSPDHHVIRAAAEHNYDGFIDTELEDRRTLGYPPHTHLLKLTAKRKTRSGAKGAATKLKQRLQHEYEGLELRGPAPAWRERVGSYYYWHLIATSHTREELLDITANLPANWRADIDPVDLL